MLHEVELQILVQKLRNVPSQLEQLQSSVNQLLTGEKTIMLTLAQLQTVQQSVDQAVQALGTEEQADVTAINKAITLIQGLQSSGGISDTDAAPILADLQTQATNLQTATSALAAARAGLQAAAPDSPAQTGSSTPAST